MKQKSDAIIIALGGVGTFDNLDDMFDYIEKYNK